MSKEIALLPAAVEKEQLIAAAVEAHAQLYADTTLPLSRIVRDFICFTWHTVPHGDEEKLLGHLRPVECEIQPWGWEAHIGTSETMFTCHLDTVGGSMKISHSFTASGRYISSSSNTILGSDDKAGVAIMLEMMRNQVPGHYYFFYGEECGGIGSKRLAVSVEQKDFIKSLKRCVSFDRRGYGSIITKQGGTTCCSDEFGKALGNQLAQQGIFMGLDTGGLFTDSANFKGLIPECTNLSVGSFNQHSVSEYQDAWFMTYLANACSHMDWESLPVVRKPVEYIYHSRFDDDAYYENLYGGFGYHSKKSWKQEYVYPKHPMESDWSDRWEQGYKWDNVKRMYLKPISTKVDEEPTKIRRILYPLNQTFDDGLGGVYPLYYMFNRTRPYTKFYCDADGEAIPTAALILNNLTEPEADLKAGTVTENNDIDSRITIEITAEIDNKTFKSQTVKTQTEAARIEAAFSAILKDTKEVNSWTTTLKKGLKDLKKDAKEQDDIYDYIGVQNMCTLYEEYTDMVDDILAQYQSLDAELENTTIRTSYKYHMKRIKSALIRAEELSDALYEAGIIFAKDLMIIKTYL